ncbi:MAG: DUF559 domain-containing protein [Candidatus Brocadiales bacterium]
MGYDDIYIEFKCDNCGTILHWAPKYLWKPGKKLTCPSPECKEYFYMQGGPAYGKHYIRMPDPPLPKLPPALYIGPEKMKRIKLTPLPNKKIVYEGHGEYHQWFGAGDCGECPFGVNFPDSYGASMDCGFDLPEEIQPYSIRSFLIQLSLRNDFPCKSFVQAKGKDDWGNIIWDEGCMEFCKGCDYRSYIHPCHLANGWMHGQESCEGWEYITKNLCQSGNETRFLHQYLRINKDRESPMPIPQAHVELTERVRVDFVMFIPITRFDWKWLVIEIDSKMYHKDKAKDFERTMTIASQGYEVLRLSAEKNMLDQVRELHQKVYAIQEAGKEKVNSLRKDLYID